MKPELKQFGDLSMGDFDRYPVWASCHSFDSEEPWYDETDEETFRSWKLALPVDPADGMFLVKATFHLPDGREFSGFVTPAHPEAGANLGLIQPYIALAGRVFAFWGGMVGVPPERRDAFYTALGGRRTDVFPIQFSTLPGLASGVTSGVIMGFYRSPVFDDVQVER